MTDMLEPGFLEKDYNTLCEIVARLRQAERLNRELLDRMGGISVSINADEMQNVLSFINLEDLAERG